MKREKEPNKKKTKDEEDISEEDLKLLKERLRAFGYID